MSSTQARGKRTLRTATTLAAAVVSMLVVTACGPEDSAGSAGSAGSPSQSTAPSTPAADPSEGDDKAAKTPQQQVDAFLAEYKAAADKNDTVAKLKVKKDHVVLQYQPQLAEWETKNSADGVFRAQSVPASFVTKTDDTKTTQDSVFVVATFQWDNADGTRVEYQVDKQDLKIRNITELD